MATGLSIALDRAHFEVGDTVRGQVLVHQSIERSTSLEVHLARGGRHLDIRRFDTKTLATGPLQAPASFPFELTLPEDGPCSYEREGRTICWRVKAKAEVRMGRDPEVEQTIEVTPRRVPYDLEQLGGPAELHPPPDDSVLWPLWIKVLFWLVFGAPLAVVAVFASPFVLYWLVRRRLIDTRLRDFEVYTPGLRRRLALGEWAPVAVRFRLKKAIRLERIRFVLRLIEEWRTSSGDRKHIKTHLVDLTEVSILPDTILAPDPSADEHVVFAQTALPLPIDGTPGTPGFDATLRYAVFARAEIAGWPDPSTGQPIYTQAAVLESPARQPDPVPIESGSRGVVAIAAGETPPEGIDISTAKGSIWLWVALPLIGFVAGVASFFVGPSLAGVPLLLAGGVALVVTGLTALMVQIYR